MNNPVGEDKLENVIVKLACDAFNYGVYCESKKIYDSDEKLTAIENQAKAQLLNIIKEAEYRGELTGMKNCKDNIRVHLNDNQGFLNWYKNRKNAIETAYIPAIRLKESEHHGNV